VGVPGSHSASDKSSDTELCLIKTAAHMLELVGTVTCVMHCMMLHCNAVGLLLWQHTIKRVLPALLPHMQAGSLLALCGVLQVVMSAAACCRLGQCRPMMVLHQC
jgi:hypothetical protein